MTKGFFGFRCAYCKSPAWALAMSRARAHLTRDHYIPKSKGGPDCPANILPSCEECQRAKGAKMPGEFMPEIAAIAEKCFAQLRWKKAIT